MNVQADGSEISITQLDGECQLSSAPATSMHASYDSSHTDMSTESLSEPSVHLTSTSDSIGVADLDSALYDHLNSNVVQSGVDGINCLAISAHSNHSQIENCRLNSESITSLVSKVDTDNVISPNVINLTSILDNQIISVMPIYVQGSSSLSHCTTTDGSMGQSSAYSIMAKDNTKESLSSSSFVKRKIADSTTTNEIALEPPSKVCLSTSQAEIDSKPLLSSTDTVIVTTAPEGHSDTLSVSSLYALDSDNWAKRTCSKEKACLSSEKSFDLISEMSDRIIPLESIPTVGIFNPMAKGLGTGTGYVSDSSGSRVKFMVSQTGTPTNINSNGVAIFGNEKIPQSLILLLKQNKTAASSLQTVQASKLSGSERRTSKSSTPIKLVSKDVGTAGESEMHQLHIAEDSSGDTDTDVSDGDELCKQDNLTRCNTVILAPDQGSFSTKTNPALTEVDTVILPNEETGNNSNENEKHLSGGFTLKSISNLSSKLLSLGSGSVGSTVNKLSRENSINDQLFSVVPLCIVSDSATKSLSSDFLISNDHQPSSSKTLSGDLLDISTLTQLGLFNHSQLPVPLMDASTNTVPVTSQIISTEMLAKETQTDMVFGANTIYFDPVLISPNQSSLSSTSCQIPRLPELLSPSSPARVPASVVMSGSLQLSDNDRFELHPAEASSVTSCIYAVQPQPSEARTSSHPDTTQQQLPKYSCNECGEKFTSKQDHRQHEKSHKKIFKCDLCNATFTLMGNYTRHRKIHNLQSESHNIHKCEICNREFLQRCDLRRHLLIHAKLEPYRCDKCDKGYVRRSDLVVHMRFHNKEKAFQCSMCDKSFFQTGDLSRHVRRAHRPNSQLTCGHCDRKYACETTLIRHMKAMHKDIILYTVNQKLQETNSNGKSVTVKSNDILFTMTEKSTTDD